MGAKKIRVGIGSNNFHGGEIDQTIGHFAICGEGWGIMYENDWMFGSGLGDGGDKYRTTGVRMWAGKFDLGLHFATGDPTSATGDRPNDFGQYLAQDGSSPNKYRLGSMMFGYNGFYGGIQTERLRHIGQNKFAHDMITGGKAKHFPIVSLLNSSGNIVDAYSGFRTWSPYTTW